MGGFKVSLDYSKKSIKIVVERDLERENRFKTHP